MKIRAICLDCGDTLIDEATEVKTDEDVSLRAELIPGAGETVRVLKAQGYPLALVVDGPAAPSSTTSAPTVSTNCSTPAPFRRRWG